jgi:hypothetical protein
VAYRGRHQHLRPDIHQLPAGQDRVLWSAELRFGRARVMAAIDLDQVAQARRAGRHHTLKGRAGPVAEACADGLVDLVYRRGTLVRGDIRHAWNGSRGASSPANPGREGYTNKATGTRSASPSASLLSEMYGEPVRGANIFKRGPTLSDSPRLLQMFLQVRFSPFDCRADLRGRLALVSWLEVKGSPVQIRPSRQKFAGQRGSSSHLEPLTTLS